MPLAIMSSIFSLISNLHPLILFSAETLLKATYEIIPFIESNKHLHQIDIISSNVTNFGNRTISTSKILLKSLLNQSNPIIKSFNGHIPNPPVCSSMA
jgi:hypothetical protein